MGKGSKVMAIADGNGLPIGIYVTSATIMKSNWFSSDSQLPDSEAHIFGNRWRMISGIHKQQE
jgi:hypothetical protein